MSHHDVTFFDCQSLSFRIYIAGKDVYLALDWG